jgi:hypothetical protein
VRERRRFLKESSGSQKAKRLVYLDRAAWGPQLTCAFSPDVVLTSFNQYDTVSEQFGINTTFRWTIAPGRDFFVIWNRGPTALPTDGELPTGPAESFVIVKLCWAVQI